MSEQPKQVTLEEAVRVAGVGKFLGGRRVLVSDYAEMVELQGDMGRQGLIHLVLAGAGHVEQSVINILSEYGRLNGNPKIRRFVEKTIARNNSLNCEKIKTVTDQFDADWWIQLEATTSEVDRVAVDSLKTLRDQIAHGKRNGTGFSIVEGY